MNAPKRLIEVDERTAIAREVRAAERGLMTALTISSEAQSTDEVAKLDRRWAAIETGEPTISNDAVVRLLRRWGSPAFKSWH